MSRGTLRTISLAVLVVAAAFAIASAAPSSSRAAGPGPTGNCTDTATGTVGNISFTAHISDTCLDPMRAYIYCDEYVMGDDAHFLNTGPTLSNSGDSKASCSATDTPIGWGYEIQDGAPSNGGWSCYALDQNPTDVPGQCP